VGGNGEAVERQWGEEREREREEREGGNEEGGRDTRRDREETARLGGEGVAGEG